MPPRTRYARERILEAALTLTRSRGIREVSARSVADVLGSSTAPVFTHFSTMEALLEAVVEAAMQAFVAVATPTPGQDPLLGAAEGWLRFAMEEPRLYEALFLHPHPWHAKWWPVRRLLAVEMGKHPRYAGLSLETRTAMVGRASIVLHGIGLERWSGRLAPVETEPLLRALLMPVIEAAMASSRCEDFHLRRLAPEETSPP